MKPEYLLGEEFNSRNEKVRGEVFVLRVNNEPLIFLFNCKERRAGRLVTDKTIKANLPAAQAMAKVAEHVGMERESSAHMVFTAKYPNGRVEAKISRFRSKGSQEKTTKLKVANHRDGCSEMLVFFNRGVDSFVKVMEDFSKKILREG
jgi:hypothetical protein